MSTPAAAADIPPPRGARITRVAVAALIAFVPALLRGKPVPAEEMFRRLGW